MISVVVYGRNDAHGYNHHRRVALSLNCLAEVLTDPDDEILFVDYNTPDELPTMVEALADTLTGRCLDLLRVLRVPAAVHTERFGGLTHLAVVEPVARNVAARRANPSNRWLLSTNTDMVLLPLHGESLSEACRGLPDGYYGLPRFELPEWVWERLPRSDPQRVLAEVRRLGPGLHLDEPTVSDEWVRYDAPGDFQLMLREDLIAIDGFDEEMLLGWHVDSNVSRRMRIHRGSIETLEGNVASYHCNHSRIPTVYHSGAVANDLERFYHSLDRAGLPSQRATWGLAEYSLEEVPVKHRTGSALPASLLAALPVASGPLPSTDARSANQETSYNSAHILPFVVDSVVVSPITSIGYLGVNPVLREMLARFIDESGLGYLMTTANLVDREDVATLVHDAEMFIVDLGIDASLVDDSYVDVPGLGPVHIPPDLASVFAALELLVHVERTRRARGDHPRRILFVNSSTAFFNEYVLAQFECSSTTFHCRVRRATVKTVLDDAAAQSAARARQFTRWALGRGSDSEAIQLEAGVPRRFAELDDFLSLAAGWAAPDDDGVWTCGSRSAFSIAFPQGAKGSGSLEFRIDSVCTTPDDTLMVELLVDGDRVATRECRPEAPFVWRAELPPHVLSAGNAHLAFTINEPRSPHAVGWSADTRPLGLRLRSLSFGVDDRSLALDQVVHFVEGSAAERFLGDGWSWLEPTGVWTDGNCAYLTLDVAVDPVGECELVLDVVPYLTPRHAELTVEVWTLDRQLTRRVFRYGDDSHAALVLVLPRSARDERGRTVLEFRLDESARPSDLGESSDPRRLGLHLRSLTVKRRA